MQKSFLRKRQGVNPLEKCKYKIFIALYTRIIILKPSDLPHVTPGSVFWNFTVYLRAECILLFWISRQV